MMAAGANFCQLLAPDPLLAAWLPRWSMIADLPAGPYDLPANLHPLLIVTLRGGLLRRLPQGWQALPTWCLAGGSDHGCAASAVPGTRILTLSLPPAGFAQLFGPDGVAAWDQLINLADLLSPAQRLIWQDACARMADGHPPDQVVRGCLRRWWDMAVPRPALSLPSDWVERSLDDLAADQGISRRQFERRFQRQFGQSWRAYRQQRRCARTLMLAVCGHAQVPSLVDIALDAGYYDQAHFNRDTRRFTGHSPGDLLRGIRQGSGQFWPYRIAGDHLLRLFGPDGC